MELENGMIIGVCTLYKKLEHYGFIAPLGDGAEVFVHGSNIVASQEDQFLIRGQKVAFQIETNPRTGRPMAVRVIRLVDPLIDPDNLAVAKNGGERER